MEVMAFGIHIQDWHRRAAQTTSMKISSVPKTTVSSPTISNAMLIGAAMEESHSLSSVGMV